MRQLVHGDLSFVINGVLFDVHNKLGKFVSEQQVCDQIEHELLVRKIQHLREYTLPSEGVLRHKVDFFIEDKIILEVKYKKYLTKDDYYQIKRYLGVMNLALGILVNFREDRLHPKRVLNSSGKDHSSVSVD